MEMNAMNFTYENQGTNTYLVYTLQPESELDSMSLGMLTNNKIPGLATTVFTQMDRIRYIKYNVTARIPASQFLSGQVNKKRLLGVFSGIVNALLAAEDYMLDMRSMVLDLDYMYSDVSTCDTVLICLPVVETEQKPLDLGSFFQKVFFHIQFDQTEQDTSYVANIMSYLNSSPAFSLLEFKSVLDSLHYGLTSSEPLQGPAPNGSGVAQSGYAVQNGNRGSNTQTVFQQVQPRVQPRISPQFVQPGQQSIQPGQQPVQPTQQPIQPTQQPVQPTQQPVKMGSGMAIPGQNGRMAAPASGGMAIPGQNGNMAVTPRNKKAAKANQQRQQPGQQPPENEKKISMFYLLQHYNKENAALYKEQKEAKKAAKSGNRNGSMPPQSVQRGVQPQMPPQFVQPAAPPQFVRPGAPPQSVQPGVPPQTPPQSVQPGVPPQTPPQSVQPGIQSQTPPQPMSIRPSEGVAPQSGKYPVWQGTSGGQNFGNTVVLNEGMIGETTELSQVAATVQNRPYLLRLKNNEKIQLDKPVFRIGKEKSYVDYFIGDNTAISRSHANFIVRNGEYFVVDTNSTNHTFINGQMIQSNVEAKLTHKAKVRLANEEFEFYLY